MGLLLPDPRFCMCRRATALRQEEWLARLKAAWFMVIEGHPARFAGLFGKPEFQNGRYLKWCVTYDHHVDPTQFAPCSALRGRVTIHDPPETGLAGKADG